MGKGVRCHPLPGDVLACPNPLDPEVPADGAEGTESSQGLISGPVEDVGGTKASRGSSCSSALINTTTPVQRASARPGGGPFPLNCLQEQEQEAEVAPGHSCPHQVTAVHICCCPLVGMEPLSSPLPSGWRRPCSRKDPAVARPQDCGRRTAVLWRQTRRLLAVGAKRRRAQVGRLQPAASGS